MRISSFARGTALAISFWTLLINGNAQDIHLSQFSNTPLLRNPALAGIFTGDTRFQAVYRNQWQSIGYPYQTAALSGEYKFAVGDNAAIITKTRRKISKTSPHAGKALTGKSSRCTSQLK